MWILKRPGSLKAGVFFIGRGNFKSLEKLGHGELKTF